MKWDLILKIGLDHVYKTWWFFLLIFLFGLSLISCTFLQQVPSLKIARRCQFFRKNSQFSKLKIFINASTDKPHKEVNHRQAGVIINIGNDKVWKSAVDGEEFFLNPGEAVFYTSNIFDFGKIP